MLTYAVIIARFYRKYTRVVEFDSPNPEKLKITVDGKDFAQSVKVEGESAAASVLIAGDDDDGDDDP